MRAKEPSLEDQTHRTACAPTRARPAGLAEQIEPCRASPADIVRPSDRPLLMVDIDGVISLFGGGGLPGVGGGGLPGVGGGGLPGVGGGGLPGVGGRIGNGAPADGIFQSIEGIPHFLSSTAAAHLLALAADFDLVWASGWEEKAEEYLPRLLGLPAGLPFLRFERSQGAGRSIDGHWKLDAIDIFAGSRPLAWIDDAFDESCHAWAEARPAPTLLVQTEPTCGLTSTEAQRLTGWAICRGGEAGTSSGV